jgi:L,D-transpeptidase ErfK/SrfK
MLEWISRLFMVLILVYCKNPPLPLPSGEPLAGEVIQGIHEFPKYVTVTNTVQVKNFFPFIDSLVVAYDSVAPYPLSEHLLVRSNPWIIDSLANTDYYRMMERDSFVYDQRQLIILRPGDAIVLPGQPEAAWMLDKMKKTHIDLNIPEFKLRIYEDTALLYEFPVRVGQNRERYLKMGDKVTDLRTKTGKGFITDYRRDPAFYNPVDGKRFYLTKRDDGRTTMMPRIPWIETEINGLRNGQLIHPTTNPKSLGKAYSNGCIGTRESDAWIIYYYAPIGTPVTIRYELRVKDSLGNDKVLKDVYGWQKGWN